MKQSSIIIVTLGLILSGVACTIVSPFLIALNLPLEVSALLNTGNSWNESKTYNIQDEIKKVSTSYVNKVKATRVSDITVFMPNPPSSGTASGVVLESLDGGTLDTLASFSNVPFDSLKSPGVSLANTSLITFNLPVLHSLLNALQDSTGLPATATITVQTIGTTSVTVPQNTQITASIHYQVDVSI